MDFEPYFKVHNLVSVHPKSVILGQITHLNMVFDIVVSVYRLAKILKLAPVPWWISERLIVGLFRARRLIKKVFSSNYGRPRRNSDTNMKRRVVGSSSGLVVWHTKKCIVVRFVDKLKSLLISSSSDAYRVLLYVEDTSIENWAQLKPKMMI